MSDERLPSIQVSHFPRQTEILLAHTPTVYAVGIIDFDRDAVFGPYKISRGTVFVASLSRITEPDWAFQMNSIMVTEYDDKLLARDHALQLINEWGGPDEQIEDVIHHRPNESTSAAHSGGERGGFSVDRMTMAEKVRRAGIEVSIDVIVRGFYESSK